jgi:hypothetical protein
MGVTINNTRYVLGAQRERIPAAQQRSKIDSKVQHYKAIYEKNYPYASMYEHQGYLHLVFSPEQGVSLGDLVRHTIQDDRFVWIDQLDDGSHFVVVRNGHDLEDKHFQSQESDPLFWSAINIDLEQYTVYLHGDLPEDLKGFQQFALDENPKNVVNDSPLIANLTGFSGATLSTLETAISRPRSSAGPLALVAGAAIIGALSLLFVFAGDDTESDQEVVDDYRDYRGLFETPSATSVLKSTWETIGNLQFIEGWNLRSCSVSGRQMTCELSPTISGYLSDIEHRLDRIGLDHSVQLIKENAVVDVSLQLDQNTRPYLITQVTDVEKVLRYNLVSSRVVDSIDFDRSVSGSHWLTRNILLKKSGAASHAILQLAQASRELPVFVESLKIDRAGVAYNIEATLKLVGAK